MLVDNGREAIGEVAKRASRVATVASCAIGLAAAAGYFKNLIKTNRDKQRDDDGLASDDAKPVKVESGK